MVIQQNSRKLLRMDILMSETCWAHKKRNKIASDIRLVYYSSSTVVLWPKKNPAFLVLHFLTDKQLLSPLASCCSSVWSPLCERKAAMECRKNGIEQHFNLSSALCVRTKYTCFHIIRQSLDAEISPSAQHAGAPSIERSYVIWEESWW